MNIRCTEIISYSKIRQRTKERHFHDFLYSYDTKTKIKLHWGVRGSEFTNLMQKFNLLIDKVHLRVVVDLKYVAWLQLVDNVLESKLYPCLSRFTSMMSALAARPCLWREPRPFKSLQCQLLSQHNLKHVPGPAFSQFALLARRTPPISVCKIC